MAYFAAEARRLVNDPEVTDLQRAALTYLLKYCIGAKNAWTIDTVVTYLKGHGFKDLAVPTFQHNVLGWSCECDVYIASGRNGIYLIKSSADVDPMMTFYESRIAAETHRLKRLRTLIEERWPRT
jgi:hypothetical protein